MCAEQVVNTDVLIIGSGAAGVTAAIEAREAGADVIVLDKSDHLGGAAAISGGGCCLVKTSLQSEKGIEDSVDLAFDDWVKFGEGSADEEWARFYLEHTNMELFEWGKARGVEWDFVNQNEGNTVPRWHHPVGGGAGIWKALHTTAVERGVTQWITSTAARELILQNGKVAGVRAENLETGESTDYMAKAIVMASGGFNSNVEMVKETRPDLEDYRILEGTHVGDTGDGHGMITELGGTLTHMEDIWFYVFSIPDHRDARGKRGLAVRGMPHAVWINMQGERFHNEDLTGGNSGAPAVMSQNPPMCWSVIDDSMKDEVTVSDPYYYQPGSSTKDPEKVKELFRDSPNIKHADTMEELAEQIGVPKQTFVETMNRYNGFIDGGLEEDPDHGKNLTNKKMLGQPPYHAFNFFPLARKNFGGVKTDFHCRVTDKHFDVIPGLYAAGELAGMAGGHINGKNGLEGTMLGPSLFSGRVAGAWAANEAGFGDGYSGTPTQD